MKRLITLAIYVLVIYACQRDKKDEEPKFSYIERDPITDTIFDITADVETEPFDAGTGTDVTDDPAVWLHPNEPMKSIVYGSSKRKVIVICDLSGAWLAFAEVGRIDNPYIGSFCIADGIIVGNTETDL